MKTLMFSLLALTACAVDSIPSPVPRDEGCRAQAEAWCDSVGYPTSGCRTVYLMRCEPGGPSGAIDGELQAQCMGAIAASATPSPEPPECIQTWGN